MLKKFVALTMVIGIGFSACNIGKNLKDSPQKTLSDYVAASFALKSTEEKTKLIEMTTGEVKSTLQKLDEASFKKYFLDTKKEFVSMKIRDERQLAPDRYSITYELTYVDKNPNAVSANNQPATDKITNKKHALFVNENGKWLISEVQNLKTYIEHQNELSF